MRVLSLVVFISAATFAQAPTSPKPLSAPRETTVKAVFVKGRGETATGGTTVMRVRLSPNKTGQNSVGVMEEFSGGTGDQWRTATWQAALAASAFNRVSLSDYEFLVRVGGHIDGPSAGLLTAATFIALQRGKAIKPNTSMTGTINPDGSSGPVGGIVQKMRGAAADGVTRFGFPIGGRDQLDVTTGERVDLLALARELKIEARELRTINEAYEFLTGESRAPSPALSESDMELSVEEAAAMKLMLEQANAAYAKLIDELLPWLKQAEAIDAAFAKRKVEALAPLEDKVKNLTSKGDLIGAYWARSNSIILVTNQIAHLRCWLAWWNADYAELARQLTRAGNAVAEVELMTKEIDSSFPPGSLVNDLLAADLLEDAYAPLASALRNEPDRRKLLAVVQDPRSLPGELEAQRAILNRLSAVLQSAAQVRTHAENARRFRDAWAKVKPANGLSSKAKGFISERSETALYASGTSSLDYLDAVVTSSIGAQAGLSPSAQRQAFGELDKAYGSAVQLRNMLDVKIGSDRLRFVIAYQLHFLAAGLSNRYYSLESTPPTKAGTITVNNTRALAAQLDLGRQRVLESCHAAREQGWIPLVAKLRFISARNGREAEDVDKLAALEEFWLAKFWCDVAQSRYR